MKAKKMATRDYPTGRAARELHVSPSHVRALCQAGMIAARATPGGHFRIPKSEIERLRREGVPEPPASTPAEPQTESASASPMGNPPRHPILLAEPSQDAIASADEVVRLGNEVKALELKRSKEENLDWFRERERKQTEARAAYDREVLERRAQQIRQEWEQECLKFGLRCIPEGAPEEVCLPVSQCVREALLDLSPRDAEEVVGQIIGAAVEKGLRPWKRRTEADSAAREAAEQLPYFARAHWPSEELSAWELSAIRAARAAIAQLGDNATFPELQAAAITAGKEAASQYDDYQAKELIVAGVSLPNAKDRQDDAREAVRSALDKLPVGSSRAQIEEARDEALTPFKVADQEARARAGAASQADLYLFHVSTYLDRLAADPPGKRNLENWSDRYQLAQELKEELRPILVEEILNEPLTLDDAHNLIEVLVKRRL